MTDELEAPDRTRTAELTRLMEWVEQLAKSPVREATPDDARDGRLLTNEAGLRQLNPPWQLVEKVVRALDCGFGNSYCCLEFPNGSYIQSLRGTNGMIVERRLIGPDKAGGYIHLRGCHRGGLPRRTRLTKIYGGERGQQRDLLQVDDVVDAFRLFYCHPDRAGRLDWRPLNL